MGSPSLSDIVTIKIPSTWKTTLQEYSRKERVPMSEVIREAIREYMERRGIELWPKHGYPPARYSPDTEIIYVDV